MTDDTKAKGKGQMIQRQKETDSLCIICSFPLAFVSSVLFFWPLYHLSFSFGLCIICPYKGQKKRTDDTKAKGKGQMIQRPKEKDR
jgi:hypothetical protein